MARSPRFPTFPETEEDVEGTVDGFEDSPFLPKTGENVGGTVDGSKIPHFSPKLRRISEERSTALRFPRFPQTARIWE